MTTVLNELISLKEVRSKKVLELEVNEVNEGREIDSASWVGVVEMLKCYYAVVVRILKESESE